MNLTNQEFTKTVQYMVVLTIAVRLHTVENTDNVKQLKQNKEAATNGAGM